ncbi:hypothetical protein ACFY00_18080 [Kitasatospora sp. NPDC001540]
MRRRLLGTEDDPHVLRSLRHALEPVRGYGPAAGGAAGPYGLTRGQLR